MYHNSVLDEIAAAHELKLRFGGSGELVSQLFRAVDGFEVRRLTTGMSFD